MLIMTKIVFMKERILVKTKTCNFCSNPLHKIVMGPRKIPLWVHRGKELDECGAFKLNKDIMKELRTVMDNIGKASRIEMKRKIDGEVVIFGETRQETN